MTIDGDLLDNIQHVFLDSRRDARYSLPAYTFVLQGLEFFLAKKGERKHVTGQELSSGLAEFAHRQFGPLAYQVLCSWGIRSTDDFGFIVYNLIEIEAMSKTENDSVEDFFNVFNLNEYFSHIDYYPVDKKFIRGIQGA
jgi:uncharacterized repeat protein (TIGR04138 family)